jgi:hypothetical protein
MSAEADSGLFETGGAELPGGAAAPPLAARMRPE